MVGLEQEIHHLKIWAQKIYLVHIIDLIFKRMLARNERCSQHLIYNIEFAHDLVSINIRTFHSSVSVHRPLDLHNKKDRSKTCCFMKLL